MFGESLFLFPAAATGAYGWGRGERGREECNIFFHKEDSYEHILHSCFLIHKGNKFLRVFRIKNRASWMDSPYASPPAGCFSSVSLFPSTPHPNHQLQQLAAGGDSSWIFSKIPVWRQDESWSMKTEYFKESNDLVTLSFGRQALGAGWTGHRLGFWLTC